MKWKTLGAFGMLETLFGLLTCNDACRQFVKTYPEFTLAVMATFLAMLITCIGISVWLLRKLRQKPAPAIEIIHAQRGRFIP